MEIRRLGRAIPDRSVGEERAGGRLLAAGVGFGMMGMSHVAGCKHYTESPSRDFQLAVSRDRGFELRVTIQ